MKPKNATREYVSQRILSNADKEIIVKSGITNEITTLNNSVTVE